MNKYIQFRAEKDEFFESHPQSPLTQEEKRQFAGLKYFSPDPAMCFEVQIEKFAEQLELQMQTTAGDLRSFIRYGKVNFMVDGNPYSLIVYSNEHGFFIPFVDSLAGKDTYGAGRYLDPEVLPNGNLELDFNLAYNPYCAYNVMYSCPIPPAENRLDVAIRAGEKNYK